jgi:uncharacterized protein with von Willebrand factor type A (vWA) domain
MISRHTSLSADIVRFGIYLRHNGFSCGVEEEVLALQALGFFDFRSHEAYRRALKSIFCRTKQQTDSFDNLYQAYRDQLKTGVDAKLQRKAEGANGINRETAYRSLKNWLHGESGKEDEKVATWSAAESLVQKDFSGIRDNELEELFRIIRSMARRLALKRRTRHKRAAHARLPDLGRTLRKNMRTGGELVELVFKGPKPNRAKLIMICDVSRSMELYSGFLIQFMYAFQQAYKRMETFVFSTSLTRITKTLQNTNFDQVLEELGRQETGWSGGTRIGEALASFVRDYGGNLLGSGTVVVILSDGWDSGDTELIAQNMEYLRKRSKKIIWLNPLAGYHQFRPLVAGMNAAMPFIDVFASAHNAESLMNLGKWL